MNQALLWLLAAALTLTCAATPAQEAWRPPRITVAQPGALPLRVDEARVRVEVLGRQAQTQLELLLFNPNDRVMEGAFEFPLQEGWSVSGFALDIDGALRPAVPVEQARGRQVFEDITRRNVDPALLERTIGNQFRLRVYPLPARGTRRVVVQLVQALSADARGQLQWQLPLDFGQPIARLSVDIEVRDPARSPLQPGGALRNGRVDGQQVSLRAADWQAREALALRWADTPADTVLGTRFDGRDYLYAELRAPVAPGPRRVPRALTLIWDASGSAAQRDHAAVFALLDALLRGAPAVTVQLVVARDEAEASRRFDVRNGDWRLLRETLQRLPHDGASNAAAWRLPAGLTPRNGIALLVSDGLANWGPPVDAGAPGTGPVPLHSISASAGADASRLRAIAEASGGRYIDLLRLSPSQAADTLLREAPRLVALEGAGAEQLLAASVHPEGGRLVIGGVMTQPSAALTLQWALPGGGRRSQRVEVQASGREAEGPWPGLAAQRWAELQIARLDADHRLHRAAIRRLGQQFGRVTRETSLIVLDSLDDYVRHEITPPRGPLRDAYAQAIVRRDSAQRRTRSDHVDRLVARFDERAAWWQRPFPKDAPPAPKVEPGKSFGPPGTAPLPAPAPPGPDALRQSAPTPMAPALGARERGETAAAAAAAGTAIRLQPWRADAPHARRLREATDAERYAIYLDERGGNADSTAFFIDAADVFFERGQTALAVRVLSNLAEMGLENRHVLRLLAYRLQQARLHVLALPLLARVRELAPEEPQSWRDLGLAHAAAGQPQRAVELLWETASRPWDSRFADIDLIALGELNALTARHDGLDLSVVDPRLRRNLPLALRALLSWDADNTDIDLWVIDPNGERAYYGHRLTYQGGRMSRDFTAGYGPEEFALRDAKPGRYEVRAQFFGHRQQMVSPHTTLMLTLSTDFGTPDQRDESVVLRLSGRGEQVLVGTFDVPERKRP